MEALAVATTLRLDRAAARREIERLDSRDGRNRVAEIIRDPDELWAGARLDYLLLMPRRCGPVFAAHVRQEAAYGMLPISGDRRLRDLTARQRETIAELVER